MATQISGMQVYAPVFKVKQVDDSEYPTKDCITNIEIDEDIEKPAMFRISLNEEINMNTQEFKWIDDSRIKPGTEFVIHFGYAMPKNLGLIRGKVKALSPGFPTAGNPTLTIEGFDLSHDLQKTQVKFKDTEVTYSMVAEEIARKNGLKSGEVESTKITHAKVERNKNEDDYALLKRFSEEIGFEFFVRDKNLYFREPKDNLSGDISFEFRKNFISFSPRMSSSTLINEVKITAWNNKEKEGISETASINEIKNSVGFPGFDTAVEESQGKKISVKLEGKIVQSKEEAKSLAIAELKRRNRGFIEGTLECIGNPQLRPGMTVNIEKVGRRFSGVYYVTNAKHILGNEGYKTTLEVRRSVL